MKKEKKDNKVTKILFKIIKGIIIFFATFMLSMSILLIFQGDYFYRATTKERFDELVDKIVFEFIERQQDFREFCSALNISCSSLDDVEVETCKKSKEIKEEYDKTIKEISGKTNLSESEILNIICSRNLELCKQLNLSKDYVKELERLCENLKDIKSNVAKEKERIYNQNIFSNVSLKNINKSLENSFGKGILLFLISIVLIYVVFRSYSKLLNHIFIVFIMLGISCIPIWYFGNEIVKKFLGESEIKAIESFLIDIFEFEKSSGILFLLIGLSGFLSIKLFFEMDLKKKLKQK